MSQKSRMWWIGASLALWAATAVADEEFPYEAFIAVDGAEVVSGPGHRYYATDRLSRGTPVEVYGEEASGWLAIRPPEGAFSWTPAEFVERAKDDESVGRVTQPTPAWIGTAAEKVNQHRQLVTLKTGELVKILGEKQVEPTAEPKVWLKIAPPAGEFRWVHLRDVSRLQPEPVFEETGELDSVSGSVEDSGTMETTDESAPRQIGAVASAIELRDIEPSRSQHSQRHSIEPAQFQLTTDAAKTMSPDGFVPRKRKGGSEHLPTIPTPRSPTTRGPAATSSRSKVDAPTLIASARSSMSSRETLSGETTPAASAPNAVAAVDRFADQLERLDLELSLMVAQNRSTWNLAGLRARVTDLVERGEDPALRGRARLLLDKIQKFEETFDVQSFGPVASASEGSPEDAEPAALDSPDPPSDSLADPRYDGQGWLKPVVSRQSDKPVAPFALVDGEGKPVMFVTPSPGMNLNRYLNRQVGVYGRRGYIAALKSSHVTVERVIDLDKQ